MATVKVVAPPLEAHEHSYISGPYRGKIEHSHADGNGPHRHPDTGPACFTIDKDEWLYVTGLRGGGRKRYTKRPSGPRLEWVEPDHTTFKVVMRDWGHTPEHERAGITPEQYERSRDDFLAVVAEQEGRRAARAVEPEPGACAVANVALSFGLEPIYVYEDHRGDAA